MGAEMYDEVFQSLSSKTFQNEEDYDIHLARGSDELPPYARLYKDFDSSIFVAGEDGDMIGAAVYNERDGIGVLEHVEVFEEERGRGIGSALVDRVLKESDQDTLYAQATSMDGKIQYMLENRGFEASGFSVGSEISDSNENTMEGFNLKMWRTEDSVQAYIPSNMQDFADKSIETQRDIEYLEPEDEYLTGSLEFVNKRDHRLEMNVEGGSTLEHHIDGSMESLDDDKFWATTVEVDVSEPVAYSILENLHDRGFRPIDFTPSASGQSLTMLGLRADSGDLTLTDESSELLETTGLDYEVRPQEDKRFDNFTLRSSI